MKQWKLYLDDLRSPEKDGFMIARTVAEAQEFINRWGMPEFISFDHDLGIDDMGNLLPDGYDFAKWLVKMDMDREITLPKNFEFEVHSKNPVGAENIRHYLDSYMRLKAKKLSF